MNNRIVILFGTLILAGLFAAQFMTNRSLRAEISALRERVGAVPATGSVEAPAEEPSFWGRTRLAPIEDQDVNARLRAVEASMERWQLAADLFMDRGQLPPTAEKLEQFRLKFMDVTASERDRLGALRMLRRNQGMSAEVVQAAVTWLQSSTNAQTSRAVLEGLSRLNDPALFDITYQLATAEGDRRLRARALENLAAFEEDPRVAQLFWTLASTSTDPGLRSSAGELLMDLPVNTASLSLWQARAMDGNATLQERMLSLRMMRNAEADIGAAAGALAQSAQATQDREQFMSYLAAFDDVNHASFLPFVVQGVQSQDAEIRRRAADALRDYRADPAALQWLQYLAQSDPDPRVREEAARGLRSNSQQR